MKNKIMKKLSLYIFSVLILCNVANASSPTGLYKVFASIKLFILGDRSLENGFNFNWKIFFILIIVLFIYGVVVTWFGKEDSDGKNK